MLVVFDVDGVILDSNTFWAHMASNYLASLGIQGEEELDEKINSYSLKEGIEYLNNHYEIHTDLNQIQDFILDFYQNKVQVKKEIIEIIQKLYSLSIPMTILTSNDSKIIQIILERFSLSKYFVDIQTNANKHQKETFVLMGSRDFCLVDDSLYALRCAKEANWKVLGIYDENSFENKEQINTITNITWEEIINENSFNNCR